MALGVCVLLRWTLSLGTKKHRNCILTLVFVGFVEEIVLT